MCAIIVRKEPKRKIWHFSWTTLWLKHSHLNDLVFSWDTSILLWGVREEGRCFNTPRYLGISPRGKGIALWLLYSLVQIQLSLLRFSWDSSLKSNAVGRKRISTVVRIYPDTHHLRNVVQLGRTLVLGTRSRRFKPCHSDYP